MFQPRRPMPPMNRSIHHSMFQSPFGYPPQQMNTQRRGFGGIIQRLLKGRSSQAGAQGFFNPYGLQNSTPSMFQGMRSPTTLQNLTNPANLSSILGNVQKTLETAEQIVPMVQQYGPLVKNIPAMWRIYRELKNTNDETEEPSKAVHDGGSDHQEKDDTKPKTTEHKRNNGKSVPKLYI